MGRLTPTLGVGPGITLIRAVKLFEFVRIISNFNSNHVINNSDPVNINSIGVNNIDSNIGSNNDIDNDTSSININVIDIGSNNATSSITPATSSS